MKKIIIDTFRYIFNDNEWFNKVLVGGMYIPTVVIGIGIVMINGFMIEFMNGISQRRSKMPYWRNAKHIFQTGWKVSAALILWYASATIIVLLSDAQFFSLTMLNVYVGLHITLHPIILFVYSAHGTFTSCFNIKNMSLAIRANWKKLLPAIFFSAIFMIVCLLLGWMWIVVGWPLLIFLSLLVQNGMVAMVSSHHLESHSS